ncbi:UpxY family transcription antiterminator [Tenacibaculum agarivorans]|uniref:UpxY family transcription antiterminator n=1 Tax=Tenacibaculum agarivorans TaxID=1908389 RepID=UPI00094B891F|nr:UpxY family transcription antiterminator [Tenacibaculum agarivorans]
MNYANGWHVIYVKSRWERRVYESLKEIDLESFLPQLQTIKQWSDRKKIVLQPLFPSYVFTYLKSLREFHKVLSIKGVCHYVRFGNKYAQVTDKEIEKMKFLVSDQNLKVTASEENFLKVGEMKKIITGPLHDFECKVLKVNNDNKIIVRIDSLKQNFTATVPSNYLCEVTEIV